MIGERRASTSSLSEKPGSSREQVIFRKAQPVGTESTVRVAVRFRPLTAEEGIDAPAFMVRPGGCIVESSDLGYSFELDRAFAAEVTQAQVYSEVGHPAVTDVLNGYNGTVLAYGQTGSGKTHCMFGPALSTSGQHGIIPRAARQVFDTIRSCAADDVTFILRCSLLEVYCEQLRDLLDPSNRDLHIQETPQRGTFVEGLTQECVTCEDDVYDILQTGEQMRMVASTQLNQLSSRSHVIFILACTQRLPDGSEKVGKLSLVDLAGSERVGKSGALAAGGIRLQEATKINCMLSALGHVIQCLVKRETHVPYRNSQLTRVLQETLGGNCKTALLVTCSAASCHAAETLSSLRFATRARLVRNHVKVNLIRSPEQLTSLVAHLQRDLAAARREASQLGLELDTNTALQGSDWLAAVPEESNDCGYSSCGDSATDDEDCGSRRPSMTQRRSSVTSVPDISQRRASLASAADHGGTNVEEIAQEEQEALAAVLDLEAALEAQDAHVKSLIAASPPKQVADAFEFLGCCAKVHNLTWIAAASQLREEVAFQALDEAEAQLARREEELIVAFERRRCQRLLAHRNEAQLPTNASTLAGDMSMLGTDVGADSTDRSMSMHCSSTNTRRRRYLSTGGRKASKVVCPISRRSSYSRRSVSGTPPSSPSATPRASPRGNSSPLADKHVGSPEICRVPALPQPAPAEPASTPLGSLKLQAHSSFLQIEAEHVNRTNGGSALAWSDMVDEERGVESYERNAIVTAKAAAKADISSACTGASEKVLRQLIVQKRAEQEHERLVFEDQWRKMEQDFREYQTEMRQYFAQREENCCNTAHGAIPQLRLELEQLDMALVETEAKEDASKLEVLRIKRRREFDALRLRLDPPGDPSDCKVEEVDTALARVSAAVEHCARILETDHKSGANLAGVSCKLPQDCAKEGSCDDSIIHPGILAPVDKENQAPQRLVGIQSKLCQSAAAPRRFGTAIRQVQS
jgi:hypothetical protein